MIYKFDDRKTITNLYTKSTNSVWKKNNNSNNNNSKSVHTDREGRANRSDIIIKTIKRKHAH